MKAGSQNKPPRTTEFEFMGPWGPVGVMGVILVTVVGLAATCNATVGACPPWAADWWAAALDAPYATFIAPFLSLRATAAVFAWMLAHAALYMSVSATLVQGLPLRDGTRLTYRMNGFRVFILVVILLIASELNNTGILLWVYDNFAGLAGGAMIFSTALSVYLYVKARCSDVMLAAGGNSGNIFYDFFIGHELNPRIGDLDLKFMCELRPGLIGWVVLNAAFVAKQYHTFGYVSNSMVLVYVFQFIYVADALWAEPKILSTMDIITDGFGWMLAFGDLAWVPFTYTMQARYLALYPVDLSWWAIIGILALQTFGYVLFRGANSQKNQFRNDPNHPSVRHLSYIQTARGTRLLTSGYWGVARHINYLGDWLMAVAWCLPCGFSSPLPYFYPIYFAVLLIHRDMRDNEMCAHKYGEDWDRYCKIVPWHIIPYIY